MYMLAAGAAGDSRRQILKALNFDYVFAEGEAISIDDPFTAYRDILQDVGEPDDFVLELGTF